MLIYSKENSQIQGKPKCTIYWKGCWSKKKRLRRIYGIDNYTTHKTEVQHGRTHKTLPYKCRTSISLASNFNETPIDYLHPKTLTIPRKPPKKKMTADILTDWGRKGGKRIKGIPSQLPKTEQNQLPADCGHPLRRGTHTSKKGSIVEQNCICS